MNVVVTFDLHNPNDGDYHTAYQLLEDQLGLTSPNSRPLPSTTLIGEIRVDRTEEEVVEEIRNIFRTEGLTPEAIFCGELLGEGEISVTGGL